MKNRVRHTLLNPPYSVTRSIPKNVSVSRERLLDVLPYVAILLRPRLHVEDRVIDELRVVQKILDANQISIWTVLQRVSASCPTIASVRDLSSFPFPVKPALQDDARTV